VVEGYYLGSHIGLSAYLSHAGPEEPIILRLRQSVEAFGSKLLSAELLTHEATLAQHQIYEEGVFSFGHHIGKLFLESGIDELAEGDFSKLQGVKQRLILIRGIAHATEALKNPGEGLPRAWFKGACPEFDSTRLADTLREICRFYLSALTHTLEPTWRVLWKTPNEEREEPILTLLESFGLSLPTLPPFEHRTVGAHPATTALTLGLAELIRNARQHLRDNRSAFVDAFASGVLRGPVLSLEVSVPENDMPARVDIVHMYRTGTTTESQTLDHVIALEKRWLSGIVATSQFAVTATPAASSGADFRALRASWSYDYAQVRRIYNAVKAGTDGEVA
jgi:hypothetical protein